HSFFPRFAIDLHLVFRADVGMRLLVREIRRRAFRGLDLHFLAGLDLDQRFGRRTVLLVGLQPDRAAQHLVVVVRRRGDDSAALLLPRPYFVRVVQVVRTRAYRHFQPAVAI